MELHDDQDGDEDDQGHDDKECQSHEDRGHYKRQSINWVYRNVQIHGL